VRVLALQEGLLAGTLALAMLYTDKIHWTSSVVQTVVQFRILFFLDMMLYQQVIGSDYQQVIGSDPGVSRQHCTSSSTV